MERHDHRRPDDQSIDRLIEKMEGWRDSMLHNGEDDLLPKAIIAAVCWAGGRNPPQTGVPVQLEAAISECCGDPSRVWTDTATSADGYKIRYGDTIHVLKDNGHIMERQVHSFEDCGDEPGEKEIVWYTEVSVDGKKGSMIERVYVKKENAEAERASWEFEF